MNKMQFQQGVIDLESFLLAWKLDMLEKGYEIKPFAHAPSTYNELLLMHLTYPNLLVVYDGGSANTIFSSPDMNFTFRAFHDFGHLAHRLDFQFKNEMKLGELQANEIYDDLLGTVGIERANVVRDIVRAEIIGQIEYYQIHRRYIDDQQTYVKGYLGVV